MRQHFALRRLLRALLSTLLVAAYLASAAGEAFDFPKPQNDLNAQERELLNSISSDEWQQFAQSGTEQVNRQKRLEENLVNSQITVKDGSISHALLLDSLPNLRAKEDSQVALKILKSSLIAYGTKCAPRNIRGTQCEKLLLEKELPATSELMKDCKKILQSRRDGHHSFRRLLPRNYKDGLHQMYSEDKLSSPRLISTKGLLDNREALNQILDDTQKSLALVQWTQFIEQDLSKPVVTSMSNGHSIECCGTDNYKLQPRFYHTACAPLYEEDLERGNGRVRCLNYVRSALAVGSKCTFGDVEQLNQATGVLDLSQLYGFTDPAQHRMRSFKDGQLKSTPSARPQQELLPMVTGAAQEFCALALDAANNTLCFMAGDSRVNANPFSIVIYTIFLRSHNQIARQLKALHGDWEDERLFQVAKAVNVDIYRRIVFDDWLPAALSDSIAAAIKREPFAKKVDPSSAQISNEFAVAAIRFYFSMMPNVLHDFASSKRPALNTNNNVLPDSNIFVLQDQIYKPNLRYTAPKLNEILESLLHQRAMKMDNSYVESLVLDSLGSSTPTHADILAYDIQRGRDHGLQGYVKYLEICSNVNINDWRDLEKFIEKEDIAKLQSVYTSWTDIDLIVGGISELPANGSTVGPTFTCILAEQFAKIRQWQHAAPSPAVESPELANFKSLRAADFLCANSELTHVPQNIFLLGSDKNPLVACADRLKALKL